METTQQLSKLSEKGIDFLLSYGPKLLGAIVVLIIGLWVIGMITKMVSKMMEKANIDVSLRPFLRTLTSVILKVLLVISVMGMVGIKMTSFVAILGAAGLAVGMALQGSLSNFAGGVMVLIFKPFQVGDLIEAQGHIGVVKEIQIFVTILLSPENKTIILPNGPLSNGDIVNYTKEGKIRVDLSMGIAYDSDIKKAKEVLMNVMTAHPKVLKDPAPFVGVQELADSAINLAVRPHSAPQDYWDVYFDIYEQGKEALDAAGVNIPFPQMEVKVTQNA